jgi:hypothetical protein
MEYSCFAFCSAPLFGGAARVLLPISVSHCFFDRCFTAGNINCEAGGIHVESVDANFSFCVFVGCYARGGGGGIAYSGNGKVLRLEDTVFISCSNPASGAGDAVGGGVRLWNNGGYIRNCSFVGCSNGCNGGGLGNAGHELPDENILCKDCIFAGNTGGLLGGGAVFRYIHVIMSSCYFYDNKAEGGGGAVDFYNTFSVTLNLCTFARNRVFSCTEEGGGYGLRVTPHDTSSVFDMSDNVFYGNLFDVSSCVYGMHILLLFFKLLFVILFNNYFLLLFFFTDTADVRVSIACSVTITTSYSTNATALKVFFYYYLIFSCFFFSL